MFIISTVITHLLPCAGLVIANGMIAHKLFQLKRKRQVLLGSSVRSGSSRQPGPSTTGSIGGQSRKEILRVISLMLICGIYLSLTIPVSIALCIRAALTSFDSECKHKMFAHLTRLLSSVRDINYIVNGYVYIFFFAFYRKRFMLILTCGFGRCTYFQKKRWKAAHKPTTSMEYATAHNAVSDYSYTLEELYIARQQRHPIVQINHIDDGNWHF